MEWGFVLGLFSLTLVLIPSRERGYLVGCFVLLYAQPLPLWIADQVRNDVPSCPVRPRPVVSRLRGNDGPGIYIIGTMLGHH